MERGIISEVMLTIRMVIYYLVFNVCEMVQVGQSPTCGVDGVPRGLRGGIVRVHNCEGQGVHVVAS